MANEPLLPPWHTSLVAIDDARNIARGYEIDWGPDLLGDWLVETRWGRIGRAYRVRTEVCRDQDDAARRVEAHLRRRASAQRRIGVAYVPLLAEGVPAR